MAGVARSGVHFFAIFLLTFFLKKVSPRRERKNILKIPLGWNLAQPCGTPGSPATKAIHGLLLNEIIFHVTKKQTHLQLRCGVLLVPADPAD
jgi:hypothetical protein